MGPMDGLGSLLLGSVIWAAGHAWCHARCAALKAGDLEAVTDPSGRQGFAEALASGISLGSVSTEVATAAAARGIITPEQAAPASSGRYRRLYDRTVIADLPWLAAHVAMTAIGWRANPACAAALSMFAWAAMADTRFRVLPWSVALAIPVLAVAVHASRQESAAVATAFLVATLLFGMLAWAVARRAGTEFGGGDILLIAGATSLSAGFGPKGLASFLLLLAIELTGALVLSRVRRGQNLIPFGAYVAPAIGAALLLTC